jgi:hypothetical protein
MTFPGVLWGAGMALLKRVLHSYTTRHNTDRWYLQFDTETKRLCILHEWGVPDDPRDGTAGERVELDIAAYLTTGDDAGRRELARLVTAMFENGSRNAAA